MESRLAQGWCSSENVHRRRIPIVRVNPKRGLLLLNHIAGCISSSSSPSRLLLKAERIRLSNAYLDFESPPCRKYSEDRTMLAATGVFPVVESARELPTQGRKPSVGGQAASHSLS